MLLGKVPFGGEHAVATITAIMGQELPDLQELRPDVPDELADLVYRMLVKDREGRVPSARLVGAELKGLIKGFQVAPTRRTGKALLDSDWSAFSTAAILPCQASRWQMFAASLPQHQGVFPDPLLTGRVFQSLLRIRAADKRMLPHRRVTIPVKFRNKVSAAAA